MSSDKTEKPTPQKLREARREGRVPRSVEVNTAVLMMVSALLLQGPGKTMVINLKWIITDLVVNISTIDLTFLWLQRKMMDMVLSLTPSIAMIVLVIMITGIVVTIAQTGFLWASKNVGFKFDRINPLNGFKRIFSAKGLIELGRALLKLLVVGWVAYRFLRTRAYEVENLLQTDLISGISDFMALAINLALRIAVAYVVLAAADFAYQRYDFMKNMRMTKQEIKEEFKRSEGDPIYKSRIRSQMRQMARRRMMASVPEATVVVTNPTHIAVALKYEAGMDAPKVVAKGAHKVAERIKEIAKENDVPVIENKPLARSMYKSMDLDQEISAEFYMAVAEILSTVYRMKGRVPQPAA